MSDSNQIIRSIPLQDAELVTLAPRAGQWLRVTEGTVWLTREGLTRDVFLVAGRRWPVQSPGEVLLEGVGVAKVVVSRPASGLERVVHRVHGVWRRMQSAAGGYARRLGTLGRHFS